MFTKQACQCHISLSALQMQIRERRAAASCCVKTETVSCVTFTQKEHEIKKRLTQTIDLLSAQRWAEVVAVVSDDTLPLSQRAVVGSLLLIVWLCVFVLEGS